MHLAFCNLVVEPDQQVLAASLHLCKQLCGTHGRELAAATSGTLRDYVHVGSQR